MQPGSGSKNPPWARSNVNTNMSGINPQIMDPNAMMGQQGMMPFQQAQFNAGMMQAQGGMPMSMGGQMPMNQMAQGQMYPGNVVAYPTPRALNPGLYQNSNSNQSSNSPSIEQRVFTGTVTKTHNDFGFVDHDVFYQTSVCAKGIIPKVNDRVLVEASFNPNMPFKWNATRVQVLPKSGPNQKHQQKSNTYNAVPPPNRDKPNMPMRRDDNRSRRDDRDNRKRSRTRSRSRSRDRRDSRARRDSPPRKRPVMHQPSPLKYVVRVPRIPLDIQKMDVPTLTQRYTNLYVPSDFFHAQVKWGEAFPPQIPFALNNPCAYHVMSKEVENPIPNDAVLEPPDADYRFSAKVMLISLPSLETLYQKCGLTKSDDKDKRSSSKNPLHPTRLIKFLVGQKGKNGENFAIGGPWSPSLDGENPQSDPKVLVKTAIRTCKALTGLDLSSCTQWYRMVEFSYWREAGGRGRLESVALLLPGAWAAADPDYAALPARYKAAADAALRALQPDDAADTENKYKIEEPTLDTSTITIDENDDEDKPEATHYSKVDLRTIKVDQLRLELRARNASCKGTRAQMVSRLSKLIKAEEDNDPKDDVMEVVDDDKGTDHNTELPATEDTKDGAKAVEEKKADKDEDVKEVPETKEEEKKEPEKKKTEKEIEEEKKKLEKEKQAIKLRYEIPSTPHILIHPSTTAKGGKFNCSVATLSLLLDYRLTDNKEHSFELFVFAELFNEMLMRDFGFYIYKTLYTLPEKVDEVKEKSEEKDKKEDKKDEKKEDKKDEKKEDKKEEKKDDKKEEKKDDKKEEKKDDKDRKNDDRRESRRRDRRDSGSDEDRSTRGGGGGRRGVELPPDPYLLLSLVYFDTMRGGSVPRRDLASLFSALGLQLSRSQLRPVLDRVCVKDVFNYKSLVQSIKDLSSGSTEALQDLPLDSSVIPAADLPPHIAELEEAIATGNRDLLPVFNRPSEDSNSGTSETKDVSDTGVVVYKGRVVAVGALVKAEACGAAGRARLEAALASARAALAKARAAAQAAHDKEKHATDQLDDVTKTLGNAKNRIASLTASSKIFHSALKSIQTKVEAVVNIKYDDDDVVEVNGPQTAKTEPKSEEDKKPSEEIQTIQDDDTKADTKTEHKDDIISTENMDLDDKE